MEENKMNDIRKLIEETKQLGNLISKGDEHYTEGTTNELPADWHLYSEEGKRDFMERLDADLQGEYITEMPNKKPMGVMTHPQFMAEWIGMNLSMVEYRKLKAYVFDHPDPKSDEFMKEILATHIRWGIDGRGKQGGIRVVHYWTRRNNKISLISCYAKNDSRLTDKGYPKTDELKRLEARIINMEKPPFLKQAKGVINKLRGGN